MQVKKQQLEPDMEWWIGWKIGKGVCQDCILSLCLFNLYAEYITGNTGLDESQVGIKISGRNISNFRYADDSTVMAESKEELKSLLMKVKEESEKAGLKLNIKKMKIQTHHSIANRKRKNMERVDNFIFLVSKITADCDWDHEIKRHLLFGRKVMAKLDSALKSRDITLLTKVHIVKAMVFPVVTYGCENWTIKTTECQRTDVFKS